MGNRDIKKETKKPKKTDKKGPVISSSMAPPPPEVEVFKRGKKQKDWEA